MEDKINLSQNRQSDTDATCEEMQQETEKVDGSHMVENEIDLDESNVSCDEFQLIPRVQMKNICSMEYYKKEDQYTQVLKDISFTAYEGEKWCITGNYVFEMRLLLEIVANAKRYLSGKCVLNNRGMMRKKKVILPHLYYIGSTSMLFHNMTVLEYLMFISAKSKENPIKRQKRLLQWLVDMGLGFVSLSLINDLSPAERSVVTLLAAACTESQIIVWNLPRLNFSKELIEASSRIASLLSQQRKTLLFSTVNMELAQRLSTNLVLLNNGECVYAGESDSFVYKWDRKILTMETDCGESLMQIFAERIPQCTYDYVDGVLSVYDPSFMMEDISVFYEVLAENRIVPKNISLVTPSLQRAIKKAVECL